MKITIINTESLLLSEHLKDNKESFRYFLTGQDGSFSEYTKRMAKRGTWGGNLEWEALSAALNVKFCIHHEDLGTFIGKDDQSQVRLVFFESISHYMTTRSKQSNKKKVTVGKDVSKEAVLKEEAMLARGVQRTVKAQKKKVSQGKKTTSQSSTPFPPIEIKNITTFVAASKTPKLFTMTQTEVVQWCLQWKILKQPNYYRKCRSKGRKTLMRISGYNNLLDKFAWRCVDRDCGYIQNLRRGNMLLTGR